MILDIHPLHIEGATFEQNVSVLAKMFRILREWEGTPYMDGQQAKGRGVDCVHFVSAVLDELEGIKTHLDKLPSDACFHSKEMCVSAFRKFMTVYGAVDIGNNHVEPGDVVICGPRTGGPGHAIIIGPSNMMWHCDGSRVVRRGCEFNKIGGYVFKTVLRSERRIKWVENL